jgi:hypothetical protein
MTFELRNWRCYFGAVAVLLLLSMPTLAANGGDNNGQDNPDARSVEMFAAIEQGDIAVKLIPKDSTQCKLLIENKTDKPLSIKLPEAFAGVPALGQAGAQKSSGGRRPQGVGGGAGGGGGMGMFNVPPEKVGQVNLPTVCLEHGKAEPRAGIPYQIEPLEKFTNEPGVRELCQMLGSGQMNQRAAQAAAWHLNNGMTWQQIAAERVRHLNGTSEPFFTPAQINTAMQIASAALRAAREREATSPDNGSRFQGRETSPN